MISTTIQKGEKELHHILIVDDEEAILNSLRDTLEGYRVTTAPNAIQALARLRERTYSVVVTDQRMPMLTGLEFLAQVRETQPDATRILITAVLSLDVVIDAINKGEIYRFIVKPWLREELLGTIHNAVQRFELISRNATLQATLLATNAQLTDVNGRLEQQVTLGIEQSRRLETLTGALEQSVHQSIELCLKILKTFYPTLGHQARRVHELCRSMAEKLGLDAAERQTLEVGARLHDIGLIGVPRHLIKAWEASPGDVCEADRALLRQHPVLGQELVEFGYHLGDAGKVIRAHHENFDGTGYPDGLRGEEIPWLARILAVAVAYAASRQDSESTVETIKELKGQAFDPEAVRGLLRCLPQVLLPQRQKEVLLAELRAGMVVAGGIYNANGLLLVPEGQRLTEMAIDKLNNHNRIHPISQSLLVYS